MIQRPLCDYTAGEPYIRPQFPSADPNRFSPSDTESAINPVRVISNPPQNPYKQRKERAILLMGLSSVEAQSVSTDIAACYMNQFGISVRFQNCQTLDELRQTLVKSGDSFDYLIVKPGSGEQDGYQAAFIASRMPCIRKIRPYTVIFSQHVDERRAVDAHDATCTREGLERIVRTFESVRTGQPQNSTGIPTQNTPQPADTEFYDCGL